MNKTTTNTLIKMGKIERHPYFPPSAPMEVVVKVDDQKKVLKSSLKSVKQGTNQNSIDWIP